MSTKRSSVLLVFPIAIFLTACAGQPPLAPPAGEAGDEDQIAGPVVVETSDILLLESFPVQAQLAITGTLPTPCHELEWEASEPDEDGRIEIQINSVVDADSDCIQVLAPFTEQIPLGSFTDGAYTVWLNGEQVGEFDLGSPIPTEPLDDDSSNRPPVVGTQGPVFVDASQILVLESFPVQLELDLEGNLPTPCHELRWSVEDPDEQGRIMVVVYSVSDPELNCIQVLHPFNEQIPLGSFTDGTYSVYLNGELVDEVEL
jgi:hypothetical protein